MHTALKYYVCSRGEWDGGELLTVTCNPDWDGQDAWDDGYMEEMRVDWENDDYTILSFSDEFDGCLVLRYSNG